MWYAFDGHIEVSIPNAASTARLVIMVEDLELGYRWLEPRAAASANKIDQDSRMASHSRCELRTAVSVTGVNAFVQFEYIEE